VIKAMEPTALGELLLTKVPGQAIGLVPTVLHHMPELVMMASGP
jgi:hypothetical protein